MANWNSLYFLASYSLGFATKCQICSAGFKCPGRKSVEQCAFDSVNGYTYSTDSSKWLTVFNPLSPNPTKWSNTLKLSNPAQTDCLSVFDHFVGLALKGLTIFNWKMAITRWKLPDKQMKKYMKQTSIQNPAKHQTCGFLRKQLTFSKSHTLDVWLGHECDSVKEQFIIPCIQNTMLFFPHSHNFAS